MELSSWNLRDRGYGEVLIESVSDMPDTERETLKAFLTSVLDAELRTDQYREVYAAMGSDCMWVPRGNRNKGWRGHFEFMLSTVESCDKRASST